MCANTFSWYGVNRKKRALDARRCHSVVTRADIINFRQIPSMESRLFGVT